MVGARFRDGYVVIGQEVAGFVPTTGWRYLAVEIGLGLVGVSRVSLSEIEIDATNSSALADELAALVQRHGGFLLDEHWSWFRRGYDLIRSQSKDHLTIDDTPPAAYMVRWPHLPVAPASERRRVRNWVLGIAGATAVLFAAAGVVTWRFTGNSDFLIAGLGYAGLIATSVVVGLIFKRKKARS